MTLKQLIKYANREGYRLSIDSIKQEKAGRSYKYYDPRTKEVEGMPYVYPIAESRTQVFICCPFCNQFHVHGSVKGDRLSHCRNIERQTYCIE